MREHGRQSEWHLRRKIARLEDWGDDEGAHLYRRILDYCEGRAPIEPRRLAFGSRWFLNVLRSHRGFAAVGVPKIAELRRWKGGI